jgi:hypothetical protein
MDEFGAALRARLAAASAIFVDTVSAEPTAAIGRALLMVTEAPHAAVFFRSPTGIVTCPWSHKLSAAYLSRLTTPDGVNPWLHIALHPDLKPMDFPKGRAQRF